jgi:hypothetical protein
MRCISIVVALLLACSASAFAPSCFMGASMQRTAIATSASCEVRIRRSVLRTEHAVDSAIALMLYAVPVFYNAIARTCIQRSEKQVLLS